MRHLCPTILIIFMGSCAGASGISEPQVFFPLVICNAPCAVNYTATSVDCQRAYNHFTFAVGQSGIVAEKSVVNMVKLHLAARKQTCNTNAKAATDNSGNIILDGMGGMGLNLQ